VLLLLILICGQSTRQVEYERWIFEATNDNLNLLVNFVLLEYALDGYASNADDIFALNRN
jgi:hypothetical protein